MFKIVTDSAWDRPIEMANELGVTVVPFYVSFDDKNYLKVSNLLKELDVKEVEVAEVGTKCAGQTFVITGDVYHYKNRNELKAYIESQGGKVTGSVSKSTTYLINNDAESQSSKNKKAHQLGISIITEEQFREKFT